ncbi:MAG: mechanosensitive ion channel [Akkermansiaceae bacterium]
MTDLTTLLAADFDFRSISSGVSDLINSIGPMGKYLVAIIIFIIGKCLAGKIRKLIVALLAKTPLDEKLGKLTGNGVGFGNVIATIIYCILLLFVVLLALDQADMDSASQPLNDMLGEIFRFVPKLIGAGLFAFLAVFGAKIVKQLLENVLNSTRLDERLGSKDGKTPVVTGLSTFAYCFVILFFVPGILGTLGLTQISEPISDIVNKVTSAVPHIITAAIVLGVGFLIAQIVQKLVKNLLSAAGADTWPAKVGLDVPAEGSRSLTSVVSFLVMLTIMVGVVVQAIELLQLSILSNLSTGLMDGYLSLLGAVIILGFGLLASKFAYQNLADKNLLLAKVARAVIVIMTGVVALDRSGIAPDLTGLPYEVAIYALGVAGGIGGAVALGLGGKDFVGRWLERRG